MKKRANWIVAAAAVLIVAAGLFLTGRQLGWFRSGSAAAVASVSGTAEVERDGLVSPLEAGMALLDGDTLRVRKDGALSLSVGGGGMTLREETVLAVEQAESPGFRASLTAGEVFLDAPAGRGRPMCFAPEKRPRRRTPWSLFAWRKTGSPSLSTGGKCAWTAKA